MPRDIGDLLMRSRFLSRHKLAALILAASFCCVSNAAWAQGIESNQLLASDGASNDQFGQSVAMSGDVIVVGTYLDDDRGTNSGSAYVYGFNGLTWDQEAKLLASDGQGADKFGIAVAVSGDVVVVGSHGDDDNGSNAGAAYVYRYDGSNWFQEQKLTASDGGAFNRFGASVAVSGNLAVIGAWQDDDKGVSSGSAYIFRFNGSSWVQEKKLLASDGAAPHQFGRSVGVEGEVIVVGADRNWANGSNSGSAYVFRRQGSNWVEQLRILASDGRPDDAFGSSVSISGGVLLIGAKATDDNGLSSGAAYAYRFNGTNWIEEQKLLAPDGSAHDSFGASVAVSGNIAMIGAWADDDTGSDSGSAYRYVFDGATWGGTKLLASDGSAGDAFGFSVAASGDLGLVGAYGVDERGLDSGSAYIFGGGCSTDFDGSGAVGVPDLLVLLGSWGSCSGCPADVVVDGAVNVPDLIVLLGEWGACP